MATRALTEATLKHRIGLTVKRYRECSGLTQAGLARKAGITPTALCYIESGRTANIATLYKVTRCLGLCLNELFAMVEMPEKQAAAEAIRLIRSM